MSKTRHPFSLKEIYTFFLRRYNQGTLVAAAAAAAKSLQSCPDSVRPHRRQPSRLPCPWDSSGKELWSGLPFLLQCVKVKSESEDAQSCPTRSDTMDCSPPGSSIHGVCQAGVLEWGAIAFSNTGGYTGVNWGIHSQGAQHSCSGGDTHAHDPCQCYSQQEKPPRAVE